MKVAVIFDLDDTLYLECNYVRSGFDAVGDFVLNEFGWTGFSGRCWSEFVNGRRGEIFNSVCREFTPDESEECVPQLVEVYRNHAPSIRLEPDSERWLKLWSTRFETGLITDGPKNSQSQKIIALNVSQYINHVIVTDLWGREYWKPHRRAFESVADATGADWSRCVYVGDNPKKDFLAPMEMGWRTIRIRRQQGLYAFDEADGGKRADADITSLDELPGLLSRWF
jgi:putative hydrolase of the HAD superfamily